MDDLELIPRKPTTTKVILVALIITLVAGGGLATAFLVNGRPKAPKPSDPNAGPAAAEFCVNAIIRAFHDETVEALIPEPAKNFVKEIKKVAGAVEVSYDIEPRHNTEDAEYSVASFRNRRPVARQLLEPATGPSAVVAGRELDVVRVVQGVEQLPQLGVIEGHQSIVAGRAGENAGRRVGQGRVCARGVTRSLRSWAEAPVRPGRAVDAAGTTLT